MAYRDDIIALGANHLWVFDGDVNDTIGTLNFTASGTSFAGAQICEDTTNSLSTVARDSTATAPSDPGFQDEINDYAYALWFRTTANQQPPCRIIGDGGGTVNNSFFLGFGNSIVCEVDCDPDVVQVGSNTTIQAFRAYHLCLVFRDIGGGSSQLEFFLDGVSQGTSDVADTSNAGRTGFRVGGITSTGYAIGGSLFQLVSPVNGNYNMFATFISSNVPTQTEIREVLFEKGALPTNTISSDTESAMQSSLNALADTERENSPLSIRIEEVSGGGDLSLELDNITFDENISIHIQYTGTGTLTIINNNGSNASIGSTPNGGTIEFITPSVLTCSPLISDSEVRIYEAGTTNEIAGIESSGTSFSSTINVNEVDVVVHKEDYEYVRVLNVDMTSGDINLPIDQQFDRNYENV